MRYSCEAQGAPSSGGAPYRQSSGALPFTRVPYPLLGCSTLYSGALPLTRVPYPLLGCPTPYSGALPLARVCRTCRVLSHLHHVPTMYTGDGANVEGGRHCERHGLRAQRARRAVNGYVNGNRGLISLAGQQIWPASTVQPADGSRLADGARRL